MIDFHYSDCGQTPPSKTSLPHGRTKTLPELKKAIGDHTVAVLQALKAAGVSPKWVQVGNEIRPGMLWDKNVALSGASYDVKRARLEKRSGNGVG